MNGYESREERNMKLRCFQCHTAFIASMSELYGTDNIYISWSILNAGWMVLTIAWWILMFFLISHLS